MGPNLSHKPVAECQVLAYSWRGRGEREWEKGLQQEITSSFCFKNKLPMLAVCSVDQEQVTTFGGEED